MNRTTPTNRPDTVFTVPLLRLIDPAPPDPPVQVGRRGQAQRPAAPAASQTAPVSPRDASLVRLSDSASPRGNVLLNLSDSASSTPLSRESPGGSPRKLVARSLGARGDSLQRSPRRVTQRKALLLSHEHSPRLHREGLGLTPEGLAAERAVSHRAGLTDGSKGFFYGEWATGVAGRALSGLGGSPEAAALFAIMATIGMLFDGYSAEKDARHARHDYVSASVLLVRQQAWLQALQAAQAQGEAVDPMLLQQIGCQIRVLARMRENFERAYYPAAHHPHLEGIRRQIEQAATTVAQTYAEVDALTARHEALLTRIAAQRGPEGLLEVECPLEALEAEREQVAQRMLTLADEVDQLFDRVDRLLSRKALRKATQRELKAVQERLAEAQAREDASAIEPLREEAQHLQEAIDAFGHAWTDVFRPFDGLAHQDIKRVRDVQIQLPRVALEGAHTALSLASLAVEIVGAQFGLFGLSAVSQFLLGFMARADNKDGKRELQNARAAKRVATERLCHAAELLHDSAHLDDPLTRALHRAVGGAMVTTQQRALRTLHRATGQAKIRRTKGMASYATVVAAILGGALSLGLAPVTGGVSLAALPFMGLPGGVNGTFYVGSVAVRALQRQHDKDQLKSRAAVAEAFVRRHGVEAILDFYADMDSDDPERIGHWTPLLRRLWQDWFEAWRAQRREVVDEAEFEVEPYLLLAAHLRDNEFLAIEYLAEALHRHAADGRAGPCAAAALLERLGMSVDTLAHLLGGLGVWATPEQHRQSARQFVAAFFPARLYPSRRLLGRLQRDPSAIAHRVEQLLSLAWQRRLSPDMAARVASWLDGLLNAPAHERVDWLNRHDRAARNALLDLLAEVRDELQDQLIGPHDLLQLQGALGTPAAGGLPGEDDLLARAWGPLLLEMLADRSLVVLQAEPEPAVAGAGAPSPGAARLACLGDVLKQVGDRLREDAPDGPAPWQSWGRKVVKRVRQTGANPLATPGRALVHLGALSALQRSALCARIVAAFAARCDADGLADTQAGQPPPEQGPRLLASVKRTAEQVLDALEQRRLQALRMGREAPSGKDQRLFERLRDTVVLCDLLRGAPADDPACNGPKMFRA
jgi:predicted  nucleic acid-binding Zn-ribbon protein